MGGPENSAMTLRFLPLSWPSVKLLPGLLELLGDHLHPATVREIEQAIESEVAK